MFICHSPISKTHRLKALIGSSPVQQLFGRWARTQIPISPKLLQPTALKGTDISNKLHRAKQRQVQNYDKVSRYSQRLHQAKM